jgi:branched-subunit amino acid ABC-type transport system permease component
MTNFLFYATNGLAEGCVYALIGVALVLTYLTSGMFNLAFGAQAYVSAVVFYETVTKHHWPIWAAFIVSVLLIGPPWGWPWTGCSVAT